MSAQQKRKRSGPVGKSCLTCRARCKKCDRTRPVCERCKLGELECLGYDQAESSDTQSYPGVRVIRFSKEVSLLRKGGANSETEGGLWMMSVRGNPQQDESSSFPQALSPMPFRSREILRSIVFSYEQLVKTSFFQPAYGQVIRVRESLSWRLQTSSTAHWCLSVGAKIFEGMIERPEVRLINYARCYDWIERLEKRLDLVPLHGLTPAQVNNRLGERLEITLFKLRTTSSINTYKLLQDHAPTFLNIVSSDSTFWSDACNSSKVSLAHVLAADRFEITHFASLDIMCSMSYGLPQVIDYDTSIPLLDVDIYSKEWIHGCPIELQMVVVKINSMRSWDRVGPMLDWQCIEQEILDWRIPTKNTLGDESWKVVAKLAIRESWRHTLLVYLYMSVCGVSSDDSRVTLSVKQIFQIINTVQQRSQPITYLHFSTQLLIAGACTPNERQRAIAREELSMSVKTGAWLLSGSDFVPVLDHLWHGAAVNGHPIRWSDYTSSRQAALPVPI